MKTKHNKGPWKTQSMPESNPKGSRDLTDSDGVMIGTIWSPSFAEDYDHIANAKLITASPELLEALINLLPVMGHYNDMHISVQKRVVAAEKAIQKATE